VTVDACQHRPGTGMKPLQRPRVGRRAVAPGAFIVLTAQHETSFDRQAADRSGEFVVTSHAGEIPRTQEVSGVGEMDVTVRERRKDGRAVEIDAFDGNAGGVFVESNDDCPVDEQRVVSTKTPAVSFERVDARVIEELHVVTVR
jgi:hypothetical protein